MKSLTGFRFQCFEDGIGSRMVGWIAGKIAENDVTVSVDDEHPRKLSHISYGNTDSVALGDGQNAFESDGRRQQFKCRYGFKPKSLI